MNLVIVESPTKARTIGKFLGKDYQIEASMGHLVDLPKSKLGIDLEHNFTPQYEIISGKTEIVEKLKQEAKKAERIILATDPDREGEAIAAHIQEILTIDGRKLKVDIEGGGLKIDETKIKLPSSTVKDRFSTLNHLPSISRIVFHEITKEAIEEALRNPHEINQNLVEAQTARRVLDRLVGYKLSPLLWMKVRRGLSAGRVQSIALRFIVEREKEIKKFKKTPFFRIKAFFRDIEFELEEINGGKVEISELHKLYDGDYQTAKTIIKSENEAKDLENDLKEKKFKVADVIQKETKRSPHPPFTTSTLQQEAARRLGFSGKKTMSFAQKLYEEGLITYHRTDSTNIASQALFAMRDFIKKEFGEKFLPEKPRFYKTKQKLAQEAHEAIRPTAVGQISNFKFQISNLGNDSFRLYELIWRRAIASQMADAIIESTTVIVDDKENSYRFKANGSVLLFEGFLKINPQALEDKKLPTFKALEPLDLQKINTEFSETQPPPRYNHASLVATLEENGIGRPSTYAPIIEILETRRYVERQEQRFTPTSIGLAVNDFLVAEFPEVDNIPFTAEMEDNLDDVAHGKKEWKKIIAGFYGPFAEKLEIAKKAERVKIEVEKTNEKCEKCGSPMVIRLGRFGKFLSCSRFPECDFKKSIIEETGLTCPKCKGKIIMRKTKKGRRFYGCSNYPTCDFAAWKKEDIRN